MRHALVKKRQREREGKRRKCDVERQRERLTRTRGGFLFLLRKEPLIGDDRDLTAQSAASFKKVLKGERQRCVREPTGGKGGGSLFYF